MAGHPIRTVYIKPEDRVDRARAIREQCCWGRALFTNNKAHLWTVGEYGYYIPICGAGETTMNVQCRLSEFDTKCKRCLALSAHQEKE